MSFKFFGKLSQDFSELLGDKKEYNVVIEVDKEKNKKSFTSHSIVLRYHNVIEVDKDENMKSFTSHSRYRSTYFTKELENTTTNENHVKTILKPNIST
ncbi:hypothetical protein Glove_372g114 [Diversispora epigaea]|uniref:BTB domain-containing protein n=1 Tax=Diversispora epigaea TaxID=1348612 RepID=A0A397H7J2_9GLOM|nr:hypothetical protein Glove_372g114 [Diversispora epigaea]